jgi:hypothetical protein
MRQSGAETQILDYFADPKIMQRLSDQQIAEFAGRLEKLGAERVAVSELAGERDRLITELLSKFSQNMGAHLEVSVAEVQSHPPPDSEKLSTEEAMKLFEEEWEK